MSKAKKTTTAVEPVEPVEFEVPSANSATSAPSAPEQPQMNQRFLVRVPNEQFNERVMGVQFNKGQATIDQYSIDASLGYKVEEVAMRLKMDFGYTVESIG